MGALWKTAVGLTILFVCFFLTVIYLVQTPANKITAPTDVFGFSTLRRSAPELPALNRYTARDGEQLAYRFYDSTAETILIFIHGSSYHGAAYHQLALALSKVGTAKVYLPNLRGHYMSGKRRGDFNYMGQLEDDIADIILMARRQQQDADIYIRPDQPLDHLQLCQQMTLQKKAMRPYQTFHCGLKKMASAMT